MLAPNPVNRCDAEVAGWYVIQTEPQRETLAHAHLTARRFRCYFPTFQKMRKFGRGQQRPVTRPMFPGYVFMAHDDEGRSWGRVFSLPGVRGLLLSGDKPALVPFREMKTIRNVEMDQARRGVVRKVDDYKVGEHVEVTAPLFLGFKGEIEKLADEERITLLLDFLGQKTRVTLNVSEIAKM